MAGRGGSPGGQRGSWAGAGLAAPGAGRRGLLGGLGGGGEEQAGASCRGRRCWGGRPSHDGARPRPHPGGAPRGTPALSGFPGAPAAGRPRGLAAACPPARGRAGSRGVSGWRPLSHPPHPGQAVVPPTQYRLPRDPPNLYTPGMWGRGHHGGTSRDALPGPPAGPPSLGGDLGGLSGPCPASSAGGPALTSQLGGSCPRRVRPSVLELCHQAVGHTGGGWRPMRGSGQGPPAGQALLWGAG